MIFGAPALCFLVLPEQVWFLNLTLLAKLDSVGAFSLLRRLGPREELSTCAVLTYSVTTSLPLQHAAISVMFRTCGLALGSKVKSMTEY